MEFIKLFLDGKITSITFDKDGSGAYRVHVMLSDNESFGVGSWTDYSLVSPYHALKNIVLKVLENHLVKEAKAQGEEFARYEAEQKQKEAKGGKA